MAKILMAIPTMYDLHPVTSMSCTELLKRRNDLEYIAVIGRPVDFARNKIIRMFKQYDEFTHLFFLDNDIGFPLDVIDKFLSLDVPIASGCYPVIVKGNLKWALADREENGHYELLQTLKSKYGPFEVDGGGAGCLFVKREVFDKVEWPWFRWNETAEGMPMSEDIWFSMKCNEAGYKTTVHPQVLCNHFKQINLTSLVQPEAIKPDGDYVVLR